MSMHAIIEQFAKAIYEETGARPKLVRLERPAFARLVDEAFPKQVAAGYCYDHVDMFVIGDFVRISAEDAK